MPRNPRMREILTSDDVIFWLVSGDVVHKDYDKDWKNSFGKGEFIGGHYFFFPYIPNNEIWISDLDKEPQCTMIHEYVERLLMKEYSLDYKESHGIATNIEGIYKNMRHNCK